MIAKALFILTTVIASVFLLYGIFSGHSDMFFVGVLLFCSALLFKSMLNLKLLN